MTKSIFQISTILTLGLGLAASQAILSAQVTPSVQGVWNVSVTVVDCQTGAVIRTVGSVQGFSLGGSFTETANSLQRGDSVGTWNRAGGQTFNASFWFFRYNPDGTFKSFAQVVDTIALSLDGGQFNASGTVQDFDANNVLLSTACFTQAATRLSAPGQ